MQTIEMPRAQPPGFLPEVILYRLQSDVGAMSGCDTLWISQHESQTWNPAIWTGVLLQLLVGLGVRLTLFPMPRFRGSSSTDIPAVPLGIFGSVAVVSAACATLGGIATRIVVRAFRSDSSGIRQYNVRSDVYGRSAA